MKTWSWLLERAYWAGEWPLLWRRGWWLLPTFLILATMNAIPFSGQLINWLLAVTLGVILVRRILAARQRRWQSDAANRHKFCRSLFRAASLAGVCSRNRPSPAQSKTLAM